MKLRLLAQYHNVMNILLINTVPTEQNGITGVIFNYLKAMDAKNITFDLVSLNTPLSLYSNIVESKEGMYLYCHDLKEL